jgi:hypothetical protein
LLHVADHLVTFALGLEGAVTDGLTRRFLDVSLGCLDLVLRLVGGAHVILQLVDGLVPSYPDGRGGKLKEGIGSPFT